MKTSILALLVVACAIVVLFAQEFGNFIKKIMAIPAMKLLLPLLLVTVALIDYQVWARWGVLWLKFLLESTSKLVSQLLALPIGSQIAANTLLIAGFSILPVLALDFWSRKKTFQPFQYAFFTSSMIWLVLVILLTLRI